MIYNRFHTHPKSMSLTEENKEDFKEATIYHICENYGGPLWSKLI